MIPSEQELSAAIECAARKAITALFQKHREHFYYLSLITTGEAHPPVLSSWSIEALNAVLEQQHQSDGLARSDLKWSYADSPYLNFGEEHFSEVRRLFSLRQNNHAALSDDEWRHEYEIRLRAMENAIQRLDQEKLFGAGKKRLSIVINVEVMPPDYTNTERAKRLGACVVERGKKPLKAFSRNEKQIRGRDAPFRAQIPSGFKAVCSGYSRSHGIGA